MLQDHNALAKHTCKVQYSLPTARRTRTGRITVSLHTWSDCLQSRRTYEFLILYTMRLHAIQLSGEAFRLSCRATVLLYWVTRYADFVFPLHVPRILFFMLTRAARSIRSAGFKASAERLSYKPVPHGQAERLKRFRQVRRARADPLQKG